MTYVMLRGRGPVSVYLYGCYELILCTYSRCSGLYFNGGLNIYIRIVVFLWIWTYNLAFLYVRSSINRPGAWIQAG